MQREEPNCVQVFFPLHMCINERGAEKIQHDGCQDTLLCDSVTKSGVLPQINTVDRVDVVFSGV